MRTLVVALFTTALTAQVFTSDFPREEFTARRAKVIAEIGENGGRGSREARISPSIGRFPPFELRDLAPVLDRLRLIKSPREIAPSRNRRASPASRCEAMRSTEPGLLESDYMSAITQRYPRD